MRKLWQKKEIRDTKDFASRRMPRSGGLWFASGDSKSKVFLIEDKQTEQESFRISVKLWEKVDREALLSRRLPLLSLQIGSLELVVMDKNDFLLLLEGKKGGK